MCPRLDLGETVTIRDAGPCRLLAGEEALPSAGGGSICPALLPASHAGDAEENAGQEEAGYGGPGKSHRLCANVRVHTTDAEGVTTQDNPCAKSGSQQSAWRRSVGVMPSMRNSRHERSRHGHEEASRESADAGDCRSEACAESQESSEERADAKEEGD